MSDIAYEIGANPLWSPAATGCAGDDAAGARRPAAVVFDLGGVVIDWNPRHLYRKLIPDRDRMEWFLAAVCSPAWNERMDRGTPFAEAVAELTARYPDHGALIAAYRDRWPEMLNGTIAGTECILYDLRDAGVPLYAITNWPAETFPVAVARYPVLSVFRAVAVSGVDGMAKPDVAMFEYARRCFGIPLGDCLFVDDTAVNVAAARAVGLPALQFTGAPALRCELAALGLLRSAERAA